MRLCRTGKWCNGKLFSKYIVVQSLPVDNKLKVQRMSRTGKKGKAYLAGQKEDQRGKAVRAGAFGRSSAPFQMAFWAAAGACCVWMEQTARRLSASQSSTVLQTLLFLRLSPSLHTANDQTAVGAWSFAAYSLFHYSRSRHPCPVSMRKQLSCQCQCCWAIPQCAAPHDQHSLDCVCVFASQESTWARSYHAVKAILRVRISKRTVNNTTSFQRSNTTRQCPAFSILVRYLAIPA